MKGVVVIIIEITRRYWIKSKNNFPKIFEVEEIFSPFFFCYDNERKKGKEGKKKKEKTRRRVKNKKGEREREEIRVCVRVHSFSC